VLPDNEEDVDVIEMKKEATLKAEGKEEEIELQEQEWQEIKETFEIKGEPMQALAQLNGEFDEDDDENPYGL